MQIEANKIMIVGDVHADFPRFNKLIELQEYPDVVIQCGDYGWWPHAHGTNLLGGTKLFDQFGMRPGKSKVFWADGNHECHDDLQALVEKHGRVPIEVQENVFYCPRGTVIQINHLNYLFMGGADSIDKHRRIEGFSWWKGENITWADMQALPDTKVDVVISHTCPKYFLKKDYLDDLKIDDPNCRMLDMVFDDYTPHYWFFAHYHLYKQGRTKGCIWRCLDRIDGGRGKGFHIFGSGIDKS